MSIKFVSLLVALLLTIAASVHAGERAGAFSVSPFFGGYTFDGVQKLETSPIYGVRLGYDLTKNWEVELVGKYQNTWFWPAKDMSVNSFSYGLDVLYNFNSNGPLVPFLAIGGGGITMGHGDGNSNTSGTFNFGGGAKYFITNSIALRADARQLVLIADNNINDRYMLNWEYTAGVTFLFGGNTAPVPPSPSCKLSANPGSVTLGESSVLGWTSQNTTDCEIQPFIGKVATQGTKNITPAADYTYTLTCTGPGGTTSSSDNVNVIIPPPPAVSANISANPGAIIRGESAVLAWTSQNATNCDIKPDFGSVKSQGKATVKPKAETSYTLTCTGPGGTATSDTMVAVAAPAPPPEMLCYNIDIEFDTAKWDIKPMYHAELEKLANFLKEYPQLTGVIEGHTDIRAGYAYNMKLSDKRAKSVWEYLVNHFGIDGKRLTIKGYGYTKPIATNKTAEGMQKNRRMVANFACVEKKKK